MIVFISKKKLISFIDNNPIFGVLVIPVRTKR